jgi:hypothetical protein
VDGTTQTHCVLASSELIGYGLGDREVGVVVPVGTGNRAHLDSYPMGTAGKATGA